MVRQWYSRCSKTGEAKALSLKTTGCVGEVSSAAWLRHDEEARPKMWLKPWARIRERSLTINNNNDDDVGDNRPLLVNNLCMPVTMFSTLHIQTWFFFPVLVSNCCYHVPYFRSEEIEGYFKLNNLPYSYQSSNSQRFWRLKEFAILLSRKDTKLDGKMVILC